MSIELHRTFWPVGHGAFYTEEFCLGDARKFTVVYDCGGKGIKKSIDDFLRRALENDETKPIIDLLFISHFHHDHINGLTYLFKKSRVKRIVIPQLSKKMLIEAFVYNEIYGGALTSDTRKIILQFADFRNSIDIPITEIIANTENQDINIKNIFPVIHRICNKQAHLIYIHK